MATSKTPDPRREQHPVTILPAPSTQSVPAALSSAKALVEAAKQKQ